jgi:hypothetical protein
MPHEVTEIKAGNEANEAHNVASELAVVEVQVIGMHFSLLETLMAEQIVAVLALGVLQTAFFHSRKHVLYFVFEVLRVCCYKFFE